MENQTVDIFCLCALWFNIQGITRDGDIAVVGCVAAREFCGKNTGRLSALPLSQRGLHSSAKSEERGSYYRLRWEDEAKATRGKP